MKKLISIILFFLFISFILFNSLEIMESIKLSFSICINNLFPSLIPFMLLSNILIDYNFINDISDVFKNLMTKIFKVNQNSAFAFIMSILSGTPSNSKYLKDLSENNLISDRDIQKCLNFCHFTNPIFIIGTIGYTFLGNKKLGLIILVSHYICSIIIGIINRNTISNTVENNIKLKQNNKSFIKVLTNSINSTISTLLLILGIITFCLIGTCLLNKILYLNDNFKFLYGIIEITQGLKYLSLSNLNTIFKACISSFLISFGGICIHMQVFSILDNKKVRYYPYLISRLLHGIFSFVLTYVLMNLFYC